MCSKGISDDCSYMQFLFTGKDLVKPVSGFVCQVCNRFLQGEDEAQNHCRTLSHHTNYCNIVRAKVSIRGCVLWLLFEHELIWTNYN